MARVLFVLVSGGGNVPSQMSIARRLEARGHEIHVLADEAVRRHVPDGCVFRPFEHAPPGMGDTVTDMTRKVEKGSPIAKLKHVGDTIMFGPAAAHAQEVRAAITALSPHAVAVDCLLFGAMAAAEQSSVPAAVLTHFPLHGPVPGAVPGGLGLAPATGIGGRLRDALLEFVKRRVSASGLATVNATRQSLGLSPLDDVFEQLLRLDRSLMLFPQEFDFVPSGLPAHVHYVGAQLDDPVLPGTIMGAAGPASSVPLVLLSLGSTYQAQERPFANAVQALGTLPVRGIASYGLLDAPGAPAPANVVVTQWVSHRELMPQASAMICHGGLGTVMKSLAQGIPVVVIPLGRDQLDNAARVEACGVGIRVAPSASPAIIADAVQRVLREPRFREGAARMAAIIARDLQADRAVAELEKLAAGPYPQ
jgi:MGT family glycosyltransferase